MPLIYLIWNAKAIGLNRVASQYWFEKKQHALKFARKINRIYPDRPRVTVREFPVSMYELQHNLWFVPTGLITDRILRDVYARAHRHAMITGEGESASIKKAVKEFLDGLHQSGKPLYPYPCHR